MEREPDIFDKIMSLPLLRVFQPLYNKYRGPLLYLFFGGVTTLINIGAFWIICSFFGINELVSNVLAWIVSFVFAFVVNRGWVFEAKTEDKKESARQFTTFLGGRLFTLACEELIIYVFITRLGWLALPVKIFAQVVVVVLNYIISKIIVFRKKPGR